MFEVPSNWRQQSLKLSCEESENFPHISRIVRHTARARQVQKNAAAAAAFYTVTSKSRPQQCVTNLRVSSSCGTLQRSPTKDREFWLLNSPPSVVSFEVIWTAVTVALRLRLELIFLHRCPPLTRSITEALKGAMYHFIHMAHLSVQPRERIGPMGEGVAVDMHIPTATPLCGS